jgi:hypothetical protein
VFKHWDKNLNRIYKAKMLAVKKWQTKFHSSTDLGLTKMSFKSSNVEDAKMDKEGLKKRGIKDKEGNGILLQDPGYLLI